ncbi:hypothetical protein ABT381_05140 [Streptomyces sp. NPDC000151]|uniref:hypothetical protein n=1 Tax=Streptomyces sp. NPDC000151 TaxID=3154244 RepID=UPI00331B2154
MTTLSGARPRAVLATLGILGMALAAAVSPASAVDVAPTVPTQLFNGNRHCSTDAQESTHLSARDGLVVEGIPGTTDNHSVTVQYQIWPVDDPAQITTVAREYATPKFEAPATVPATALTDGQAYAWRAQTVAGSAASNWSASCYVTVDNTRPAQAPTVSSPNYPLDEWSQGGEPVRFTLDANGDDDITGFQFTWHQSFPVIGTNIGEYGIPEPVDPYSDSKYFKRADAPGGSATLSLVPPHGSGPMTLWVRSLDRTFNSSTITSYKFFVRSTAPTVTPAVPSPEFGSKTTFTLRPDAALQSTSPVVSYSVKSIGGQDGDKTVDVVAEADGTAQVEITLDGLYGGFLQVTSRSANGWVSDAASWSISYDTTPTVASETYLENESSGGVGIPGTFTFAPKVGDVVSYTYSFDGGPETTVAAGDDHTASTDWTPDSDGGHYLSVSATTRSGIQSAVCDRSFTVN